MILLYYCTIIVIINCNDNDNDIDVCCDDRRRLFILHFIHTFIFIFNYIYYNISYSISYIHIIYIYMIMIHILLYILFSVLICIYNKKKAYTYKKKKEKGNVLEEVEVDIRSSDLRQSYSSQFTVYPAPNPTSYITVTATTDSSRHRGPAAGPIGEWPAARSSTFHTNTKTTKHCLKHDHRLRSCIYPIPLYLYLYL